MTLSRGRWQRIAAVFERALAVEETSRAAFVDDAMTGDPDARDEVLRMLAADAQETGPCDLPVPQRLGADLPAVEDTAVGDVIGSWQLVEPIGQGGMGTVHRARRNDGAYEQEAALKRMRVATDPASIRRFTDERQTLARLSHPNIARLLDGGTTPDGEPFLVMELVRGAPIDRWCRERRLDARARIDLLLQVAAAVEYAHRNLVVHGDLKPGNVLVDDAGRPMLLDFGVSRMLGPAAPQGAERAPLTPGYASPEQVRGEPLTTAADVFALGVLLDRLLADAGATGAPDLDAVLTKARAADVAARYESVAAFADDLRRYREHRPVAARPPGVVRAAAMWARRNTLSTALAACTVAALVGGTAVALNLAEVARGERDTALAAETAMKAERETARRERDAARRERDHADIEAESSELATAFLIDTLLAGIRLSPEQREETRAAALRMADRTRRQFADLPHLRANLLDALAAMLLRLGHLDDAEAIVREVLTLRQDVFGSDSIEVALSLQSLGELCYERQDLEAALAAFRRAYELHRSAAGSVHADVGTAANNLAACLRSLGRLDEARRLHEEALAVRTAASGPDSLPAAESRNNLGVLALSAGDPATAIEHLEQALADRGRLLGADAPLTLQTATNLAGAYWQSGDGERAVAQMRAAAAGLRELRSAGDPFLARVSTNLAALELLRGEVAAAIAAGDEALAALGRIGAADGPGAVRVHEVLAKAHERAGRFDAAADHWQEVVAGLRRHHTDAAPLREARVDHCRCLVRAERFDAARRLLDELDAEPPAELGEDRALVDYLLAVCLDHAGDAAAAAARAAAALPALQARFGAEHAFVERARTLARVR